MSYMYRKIEYKLVLFYRKIPFVALENEKWQNTSINGKRHLDLSVLYPAGTPKTNFNVF